MSFLPSPAIDLEAPYQDACRREERLAEIESTVRADLWLELAEISGSEKFIKNWVGDPDVLLIQIIKTIALTRLHEARLVLGLHNTLTTLQEKRNERRLRAFKAILMDIEKYVDSVAETKARQIYQ